MPTIMTNDRTQIYYKDWGTGQPVVFSHGWPLSADAFEDQMFYLASRGYRCIAHDRRGSVRFDDTELSGMQTHRIVRRSTTYGAPYDPHALSAADDEVPRGTYFTFLSAKAMATMEFLQSEWINNGNFMGLGDERDPNVGLQEADATFTIPKEPVRRRIHGIETFNVLRGGEYLFLPSLSALRWLAALT